MYLFECSCDEEVIKCDAERVKPIWQWISALGPVKQYNCDQFHLCPLDPCRALMNTAPSRPGRSAATRPDNEPVSVACLRDLFCFTVIDGASHCARRPRVQSCSGWDWSILTGPLSSSNTRNHGWLHLSGSLRKPMRCGDQSCSLVRNGNKDFPIPRSECRRSSTFNARSWASNTLRTLTSSASSGEERYGRLSNDKGSYMLLEAPHTHPITAQSVSINIDQWIIDSTQKFWQLWAAMCIKGPFGFRTHFCSLLMYGCLLLLHPVVSLH